MNADLDEQFWQHVRDDPRARPDTPAATRTDRFRDGAAFILDIPERIPAIWGHGDEVLWSRGEALMIAGPPGVGKTTLAAQIVRGLIGQQPAVLGLAIRPVERVLYLAMDRPQQIARALARTFNHHDRSALAERCVVWPGPPPADLAAYPDILASLAADAHADVVIVDSLKDAAVGLVADDVAAAYNRARQTALAAGVEVLELHHMVKRGPGGAEPTALADVYGSMHLTAGAGSVVLLWGQPGDPVVTLRHLKQPADEFGPHRVVHDHHHGVTTLWQPTDLVSIAVASGVHGVTARAAAVALFDIERPTPSQVEKARRRLEALTRDGRLALLHDGDKATQTATTWTATRPITAPFTSHHNPEGITS